MKWLNMALLVTLASALSIQGEPADVVALDKALEEDGMTIIRQDVDGLGLKFYVNETATEVTQLSTRDTSHINKRCGTNFPLRCDTNNQAYFGWCEELIDKVDSNPPLKVPNGSTSVCSLGNLCCISWNFGARDVLDVFLVRVAKIQFQTCRFGNFVSAKTFDVQLAATCGAQCLSNRPNAC